MLELIKGASFDGADRLKEEYDVTDNAVYANVNAGKIRAVFEAFLDGAADGEPLFMFIEAPCNIDEEVTISCGEPVEKYHRNVYYLDGIYRSELLAFLKSGAGDILINDGLSSFGIGSFKTHVEIGKYKYNVMTGYPNGGDLSYLTGIFDRLGIPREKRITTAWELFSDGCPGESRKYSVGGQDVYTVISGLGQFGMYKAETREEK